MTEHLDMHIGEHYQYCGSDYQVADIRADRIQLRSLKFSNQIVYQKYEQLARAWRTGGLVKTQEAPFSGRMSCIADALTPRQKAVIDKRLCFLRPALERWNGHLPRREVVILLAEIASDTGYSAPSYGTLYLWRKAYLAGGENKLALITKPRRRVLHRIYKRTAEVQAIITSNIRELYNTPTPCRKAHLIEAIRSSIEASNERRLPHEQLEVPSTSTLYRIIVDQDRYETDLVQKGYKTAIRNQKWSKKCPSPWDLFDLVEGDTHEFDVVTCDERGHPIARLWLTALIEVKSRMIVGWDLSYNPPCIEKTMRALKSSLVSSNPLGGLARRYRVDNGSEFANARLKSTLQDLGSDVTYCEPGNPDQKPHIESFFCTWTTSIAQCLKGTTFSKPTPYDSEKNAIYTLTDLKQLFQRWLNEIYHANYHTELTLSPPRGLGGGPDKLTRLFAKKIQRRGPGSAFSKRRLYHT